jgi:hypothetical protein
MSLFRLIRILRATLPRPLLAFAFLIAAISMGRSSPLLPEVIKMFPSQLGGFHLIGQVHQTLASDSVQMVVRDASPIDFGSKLLVFDAEAEYASPEGERLIVVALRFENESAAYSRFTAYRKYARDHGQIPEQMESVGTASVFASGQRLGFFKGSTFIGVTPSNSKSGGQLMAFGRSFAATLDKGEGDIPVLVKHLPNWEVAQRDAQYAVSARILLDAVPDQPILSEVGFEGGTEAVTANYGQSQLVIVEFTTPQFASDNDRRITAKIQELKNQGQPTPTGYRRVGNYSVFVFNATDEKTANALIDQVKYEQVVHWLGDDPHLYERVQRYVLQKTGGVVIAVLESSGLSVLLCVGVGGLFGALLFRRRRRARQRQGEAYSDAGGMVRLNLDEATEGDAARLLQGPHKDG